MPRSGKHPLKLDKKDIQEVSFKPVTVTTIVHVPMLAGYWEHSLEVLDLFFQSLFVSTSLPFDLIVFDNHSCSEVQDYLVQLHHDGKIQQLILSEYNLKKLGALDQLFSIAKGDYVAYADSDVYFLPGWLNESIKVLDAFPEIGQVTALPTIDKFDKFTDKTISGIKNAENLAIKFGTDLIPASFIQAHQESIGKQAEDYEGAFPSREDIRIERDNIGAFVSAQDFQFTTRRNIIQKVLPLAIRSQEEVYDSIYSPVFEAKVNEFGYWRVSITDYLVHHMGNQVPDLKIELPWLEARDLVGESDYVAEPVLESSALTWILNRTIVRRILKWLNTLTYKLLFEKIK